MCYGWHGLVQESRKLKWPTQECLLDPSKVWREAQLWWAMCCCLVAKSCLTLCDPMDYSSPGPSVHGIFQARILEWVAFPFSRASSQPRDWTQVSCITSRFFTIWASREAFNKVKRVVNTCLSSIPWYPPEVCLIHALLAGCSLGHFLSDGLLIMLKQLYLGCILYSAIKNEKPVTLAISGCQSKPQGQV